MLSPGDVVVALFCYSDLSGAKYRPALVVSTEEFNKETGHLVLAAISRKPVRERYDLLLERWKEAGLRLPSKVRVGRLLTVEARLVKKIGTLPPEEVAKVTSVLREVICQ